MEITVKFGNVQEFIDMYEYVRDLDLSQKGKLRLQGIWRHMKCRCYGKSRKEECWQKNNIKVCQDWLYSFDNFYHWAMSNGYQDDLTIDRLDPTGNYTPMNCRWITGIENSSRQKYSSFYKS